MEPAAPPAGPDDRPYFTVAVVGGPLPDPAGDRLASWLDVLVSGRRPGFKIGLVSFPGSAARPWAEARNLQHIMVTAGSGRPDPDCELLSWADALVVVGDPAPWERLVRLAAVAGVPVRFFRG